MDRRQSWAFLPSPEETGLKGYADFDWFWVE